MLHGGSFQEMRPDGGKKGFSKNKQLGPRKSQKRWKEWDAFEKLFKELETDDLLVGYGVGEDKGPTTQPSDWMNKLGVIHGGVKHRHQ